MLEDKIALITGSSRGIGRAIALEFAKNNAGIIINYNKDKEGALKTESEIKKIGKVLAIKADVSSYEEVSIMVKKIRSKFKKIDILVNNAGITVDRTLKNMSQNEWNDVLNTNLNGVFNVTKQVLPSIPKNGRIINISSIVGVSGNYGQSNYAASKAGVIGFTKSIAKELGRYGITVNAIAPGFIETEMTNKIPFFMKKKILSSIPLGRYGLCKEVAKCALFLASEDSSYITGQVIRVDGGIPL